MRLSFLKWGEFKPSRFLSSFLLGMLTLTGCTPIQTWAPTVATANAESANLPCDKIDTRNSASQSDHLDKVLNIALESESEATTIEALKAYSLATAGKYKKSHSVQLFRDASYALCVVYHSGHFSDAAEFSSTISSMLTILENEVSSLTVNVDQHGVPSQTDVFAEEIAMKLASQEQKWNELIENTSIHSAYLLAQMSITKMAFDNLIYEYEPFYSNQ